MNQDVPEMYFLCARFFTSWSATGYRPECASYALFTSHAYISKMIRRCEAIKETNVHSIIIDKNETSGDASDDFPDPSSV